MVSLYNLILSKRTGILIGSNDSSYSTKSDLPLVNYCEIIFYQSQESSVLLRLQQNIEDKIAWVFWRMFLHSDKNPLNDFIKRPQHECFESTCWFSFAFSKDATLPWRSLIVNRISLYSLELLPFSASWNWLITTSRSEIIFLQRRLSPNSSFWQILFHLSLKPFKMRTSRFLGT